MNKAIEIFGNHIYKLTQSNPEKALKQLSFVYTAAGLQCKYLPSKLLLPARQYMQWAAADSAIKPLRNPQNSAIVSLYLPCEILHAMGIYQMFPEALSCYLAAAGSEKYLLKRQKITVFRKPCVPIIRHLSVFPNQVYCRSRSLLSTQALPVMLIICLSEELRSIIMCRIL